MPIGVGTVDQGQAGTDPWPVSIGAIALPTGAATAAKQDTGNASLASIDGKIVAVNTGAVVVASSALPTGAAAEHITAASPHATRLSDGAAFYDATKTGQLPAALVGGRLDVNVGNAVTISGTVPISGTIAATQSGTWNITNISGTISLPTGASTSALQTTGNTSLASIDTKTPTLIGGRQPVDGSGVTQPVSGTVAISGSVAVTGTFFQATQPVSAAALPLPSGASTSALQTTGNTSLASIDGKITAVNTGAVVVSSSALPTGAATSANQTTEIASLATLAALSRAEDAAHTTGDTGVMMLAVRNDSGAVLAGTTGDYIPPTTDATGALRVTGGGGGTQYVEDTPHVTGDTGTMLLAVRNDGGAALAGTSGDYIPLSTTFDGSLRTSLTGLPFTFDVDDHLLVSMLPNFSTSASTAWTSATALDTQISVSAKEYPGIVVTVIVTGAITAGGLNFEAQNEDAAVFPVQAVRLDTLVAETTATLATSLTRAWLVDVRGMTSFRVRLNPVIVGAGTATLRLQGSSLSTPTRVITNQQRSTVTTQASVADNVASVTLLAANATRLGATIANDSSGVLLVKLGATASATSYTVRMVQSAYYEVPFGYTGVIDGIWLTDPNDGAARVTELLT